MLNKFLKIIIVIVLMILSGIVGYYVGSKLIKSTEKTDNIISDETVQYFPTFYATIEEIIGTEIWVNGLEINDISDKGKFILKVQDTTILKWRGTKINLSDLKVGHTISITWAGYRTAFDPSTIYDVVGIKLLNYEM